jgi:hypothetical protein
MSLYDVYLKKNNKDNKIEDVVCLKDGFSWLAFFFGPFWFLYHKMLKEFLILIAVNIVFVNLSQNNFLGNIDFFILHIGFVILVAINANFWRALYLKKKNYQFSSVIISGNCDLALVKFISCFNTDKNYDFAKFSDAIINPEVFYNKSCLNFFKAKKNHLIA